MGLPKTAECCSLLFSHRQCEYMICAPLRHGIWDPILMLGGGPSGGITGDQTPILWRGDKCLTWENPFKFYCGLWDWFNLNMWPSDQEVLCIPELHYFLWNSGSVFLQDPKTTAFCLQWQNNATITICLLYTPDCGHWWWFRMCHLLLARRLESLVTSLNSS